MEMQRLCVVVLLAGSLSGCGSGSSSSASNSTPLGSGTQSCTVATGCKARSLESAAYGAGIFMLTGQGGKGSTVGGWIETSTDGVNWSPVNYGVGSINDIYSVAYGTAGFLVVAQPSGTAAGDGKILLSTDGRVWRDVTPANIKNNSDLNGVNTLSWDGKEYLFGSPNAATLYRSADGKTWTAVGPGGVGLPVFSVQYGSGQYVGAWQGSDPFASSTDWTTWTQFAVAGVLPGDPVQLAYGGPAGFISVGKEVVASVDGKTWTTVVASSSAPGYSSVAVGGTTAVALSDNCDSFLYSTDGTHWINANFSTLGVASLACSGSPGASVTQIIGATSGAFLAFENVPNQPLAITSADGIHWAISNP